MSIHEVVSPELAKHLATISRELGRQVGILVSREGMVRSVIVGDTTHLVVPEIGRLRGGAGRFRGLRLVHTHLRGEPLTQDDLNDLALLRLDLIVAVQVDSDGNPGSVELAHILPLLQSDGDHTDPFRKVLAKDIHNLDFDFDSEIRALESEFSRVARGGSGSRKTERALIVGVSGKSESLSETVELVRASGVDVASVIPQKRRQIHPRTIVGRVKLQEIVLEGMRRDAEVVIFDIDLKPAQARAFEDATGLKAIDRTQLILDIFAQRAKSRDGKLQVELAQLKYSLPRLTEKDAGLSRLTGGIGGRGPGETVLEIGRRRARDRIRHLEKSIAKLSKQRSTRRQRRLKNRIPTLSIIGYTNAGKSTLLNAMTESRVGAADKMFETLDPTSRRLRFPAEGDVVITDTVGFIQNLPAALLTAFRATLEELDDANLLLHVVDASDSQLDRRMEAVEEILTELGLGMVPRLVVLNKCDLLEPEFAAVLSRRCEAVAVSALRRQGLDQILVAAEARIRILRTNTGYETGSTPPEPARGDAFHPIET